MRRKPAVSALSAEPVIAGRVIAGKVFARRPGERRVGAGRGTAWPKPATCNHPTSRHTPLSAECKTSWIRCPPIIRPCRCWWKPPRWPRDTGAPSRKPLRRRNGWLRQAANRPPVPSSRDAPRVAAQVITSSRQRARPSSLEGAPSSRASQYGAVDGPAGPGGASTWAVDPPRPELRGWRRQPCRMSRAALRPWLPHVAVVRGVARFLPFGDSVAGARSCVFRWWAPLLVPHIAWYPVPPAHRPGPHYSLRRAAEQRLLSLPARGTCSPLWQGAAP